MDEPQMSFRAGIVSPIYQPIESPAPPAPSADPVNVKITITPPTPMVEQVSFARDDEDTHKEVMQLGNISEEKEVYDHKEILEEKQVYVEDSKEAIYNPATMRVNSQHVDEAEEKILDQQVQYVSSEKEAIGPQSGHIQHTDLGMVEKEVYNPDEKELGTMESEQSPTTTENGEKVQTSVVQRQLDTMSQAVDKRKKALTTFTTQSNTRIREGYAQLGQNVTNRSTAMEQGANARLKRLGQGLTERMQRVEKGTTKRFNRLEKGFNDQVSRAEKNVDDRVASLKQNINNVKGLGSKNTKGQLQ